MAAVAWVSLGSNIGNRGHALAALRAALEGGGVRVTGVSPEVVTRPVGLLAQADFHNQVLRLESSPPLTATSWLRRCREAETAAGRRRTIRWGPRRADADVLLLGETGRIRAQVPGLLVVPHPGLRDRAFLWPLLAAVEPGLRHQDGWLFADGPPGAGRARDGRGH
ncbi:MAG TPA: 2-amino-4-hydroxy-6-hydroxymethyldihydropteridine diphosphokinase [Candidatus Dormibacteraeota bacterium]|nr:2-amino-4-hydroxy-6-hydroxymethyldihydropteridine diphosphokinase [Candidatus Dormibacteraeota bacterium]